MPDLTAAEIPLSQLLLDPNNYRFLDDPSFVWADESRFHEDTVQERAYQRLRESSGFEDLKNSIMTNGFLPIERIVVRPDEHTEGKYVVVEGNRRVGALRWIKRDHEAGVPVPQEVVEAIDAVPVILIENRDPKLEAALMGVRHVSGIKDWGPYQRARIVAQLRDEQGMDAQAISKSLGMSAQEANRRYRAYKALEQMSQHEEYEGKATPKLYPLFHELVSQPQLRDEWLHWNEADLKFDDEQEAAKFFDLITPTETENDGTKPAKVTTSDEVREIKSIIPNPEARTALFDPNRTYLDSVVIAKKEELSRAWAKEVQDAITALEGIEAREVKRLDEDDLRALHQLRDLVDELLGDYEKLTA